MSPVLTGPPQTEKSRQAFPWFTVAWIGALLAVCYGPILASLAKQWYDDPDMGHGFFVPLIAGFIAWQTRDRVARLEPRPNWWGLAIMVFALLQLYIATLGAELFTARTSFVFSLIGTVLFLGGTRYLKAFAFPLFLLFFMVPIPAIIYNQLTFRLQIIASAAAEHTISILQIPIIREGNVLELANQKLNVVEACSGIRSLLTLTFLTLVYGYFTEKRTWVRVLLFLATIPIAVIANAGRVTFTGLITTVNPELAEGFFHEAQGWVIFMIAFAILVILHQLIIRTYKFVTRSRHHEPQPA